MKRYDIAILGTGPAGMSAAVTARARNKDVLLIGRADLSQKLVKAKSIENYLGFPKISGEDLANAFAAHIASAGVPIVEDTVSAIYNMGDYFGLQGSPEIYEATTVILATGAVTGKMIAGEEELLGRGVSHCATCDAGLYRGRDVVVVGYAPREEAEADFLAEVAAHVRYVPMYKAEPNVNEQVEVVRMKPLSIESRGYSTALVCDGGDLVTDGLFVLRESVPPSQLLSGIEVSGAHVVVDRTMATSVDGCFACGDVVGEPYQYIKSAGEGNVAALSAVKYLAKLSRE